MYDFSKPYDGWIRYYREGDWEELNEREIIRGRKTPLSTLRHLLLDEEEWGRIPLVTRGTRGGEYVERTQG